uniref:Uncharacterized protein n=1 Tax=Sphaerodactylus townsendi TaxID=933632 RepID=A0ACB8FQ94_9SAUR
MASLSYPPEQLDDCLVLYWFSVWLPEDDTNASRSRVVRFSLRTIRTKENQIHLLVVEGLGQMQGPSTGSPAPDTDPGPCCRAGDEENIPGCEHEARDNNEVGGVHGQASNAADTCPARELTQQTPKEAREGLGARPGGSRLAQVAASSNEALKGRNSLDSSAAKAGA